MKENSTVASEMYKGEDFGTSNGGRTVEFIAPFTQDKLAIFHRRSALLANKDTDFKKMKMKALNKILKDRGEICEDCVDKSDFIKKVFQVIDKTID